jgi:hypothetical protein
MRERDEARERKARRDTKYATQGNNVAPVLRVWKQLQVTVLSRQTRPRSLRAIVIRTSPSPRPTLTFNGGLHLIGLLHYFLHSYDFRDPPYFVILIKTYSVQFPSTMSNTY